MFERFTKSASQVVVVAHEQARELRHGYIGTEHVLLGLLAEPSGIASQVLNPLGVTVDGVREDVVRTIGTGNDPVEGQIPFTPRVKEVMGLALREALALSERHVGPGHLLLAVGREGDGTAMRILVDRGVDADTIRSAVIPLLPEPDQAGPQIPRALPQPGVVSSDPGIRRVLMAASSRAIHDHRTEFHIGDLLAVLASDEEAGNLLAALGVDVQALREAVERELGEDPAG